MRDRKTTFAVLAALLMLGWAVAPVAAGDASLSVSVSQGDTGVTVTVEETVDNETSPAGNATVTVEVLDENVTYAGAGTHATDGNGTVSLPEPNETVNVSVTAEADNLTAATTATLVASNSSDDNETDGGNETDSFGDEVSDFVSELQNDSNVTRLGPLVASFVVENNPGNAPDHAGPPDWLVNSSKNNETGPPPWAGPPGDDDGNETDQGPPDDRGPPDDDDCDDDDDGDDDDDDCDD